MHLEQKAQRVRNGGKEPGHVQGFSVTDFEVLFLPSQGRGRVTGLGTLGRSGQQVGSLLMSQAHNCEMYCPPTMHSVLLKNPTEEISRVRWCSELLPLG